MSNSKRNEMLEKLGNEEQLRRGKYSKSDRNSAEEFVRDNIARPLTEVAFRRTVDDVLEMNPAAWEAWLRTGSKEDWSSFVGVLELPALIVAGSRDGSLGPKAQRTHTLPHYSTARLAEVDCSHLVPLEKPEELAQLIVDFLPQTDPGVRP